MLALFVLNISISFLYYFVYKENKMSVNAVFVLKDLF